MSRDFLPDFGFVTGVCATGSAVLFRDFLVDVMVSVSDSETRGAFTDLRAVGVFDLRPVLGVGSMSS